MAKLTVKNVGPIREAEFEVKKHTVFIGPQGSGKSTLAKLIAICRDKEIALNGAVNQFIFRKYSLQGYLDKMSNFFFQDVKFDVQFSNSKLELDIHKKADEPIVSEQTIESWKSFMNGVKTKDKDIIIANSDLILQSSEDDEQDASIWLRDLWRDFVFQKELMQNTAIYVPAERTLLSILNEAVWSLINSNVNFPKSITSFARTYSQDRINSATLFVPFLNIKHQTKNNIDYIILPDDRATELSHSASSYQAIIPMLVVIEQQHRKSHCYFIIEEPELSLYPTAQKDLIYALMSGLDPNVEYQDAEWVITTHSPYVLSSFNTLMLAYKVAQKSDELRAEVEKIIPARCWINPDEFAAYYVDNGTVRSIISEKTGLIADNELDDVSEDLAGEQDQLLELYRNIPSA